MNKSIDLLNKSNLTEFKKFKKPALEIQKVKIQWADSIKQQLAEGYTVKEAANVKADSIEFNLLEQLKQDKTFLGHSQQLMKTKNSVNSTKRKQEKERKNR